MRAIADTGFLVAFAHADDQYHYWAKDLAKKITPPLLTCESVLSETAFHLRGSHAVLRMMENALVQIAFNVTDNLFQLIELAEQYRDRHPDFADLCLIRMSELFPEHAVITTDESDFRVYRRNKRSTIPILVPPRW